MKRTAKWMNHLTISELKHIKENNATLSLRSFKWTREKQRDLAARLNEDLWRICVECNVIENKLKEAGVIK